MNPKANVTLPKRLGWVILTLLLFLDAFLTVIRGTEGNPLWIPVVNTIGTQAVPFLVPLVLVILYIAVKAGGRLVMWVDKLPQSEEIVLTTLVLVFAVYDIWVISVDFFDFRLIQSHYHLIPVLIIVILAYDLSAEYIIKKTA